MEHKLNRAALLICAALLAAALALPAASQAADVQTVPAVMMQEGGSLWTLSNGLMRWVQGIRAGSELELCLTEQRDSSGRPKEDVIRAWRVSNGESAQNEFARVRYQGQEFWVIRNRIARNPVGHLSAAAALYRSLELADVRNTSLPAGTLVTVGTTYPVTAAATPTGSLALTEIWYFDTATYTVRQGYVRSTKIALDSGDPVQ